MKSFRSLLQLSESVASWVLWKGVNRRGLNAFVELQLRRQGHGHDHDLVVQEVTLKGLTKQTVTIPAAEIPRLEQALEELKQAAAEDRARMENDEPEDDGPGWNFPGLGKRRD